MNKNKRMSIREAILDDYKLGTNPHDTSLKIQKMFGYNFETRLSTIRMWFEQFYLGDESLENDPFRDDLIPKKRETRKRKCVTNPKLCLSQNEPQTKLLFQLKKQVDLMHRTINAQDCCLKLVDRFIKKLNNKPNNNDNNITSELDAHQNTLETFCKNFRFLRKKCQKFSVKNSVGHFYKILYDNLYRVDEKNKKKMPNDNNNKVVHSKRKKIAARRSKSKTAQKSTNAVQSNEKSPRKRGRPRSSEQFSDKKWPKLPIQLQTNLESDLESLQCPISGCLHVAINQKMFTIHQSTHVDHCIPISKDQENLPAKCDECGKVLKSWLRLKIHIQQMHQRTERFNCPLEGCDASYAHNLSLRRHIRKVHTKDAREYRCTWTDCSYVAYNKPMLRTHLNVHTGERPYKCVWPGCEKAFKSHSSLDFHKSIHENKRQYKCRWPGCGYACNVSSNLNKHTAIHERKQSQMNLDQGRLV